MDKGIIREFLFTYVVRFKRIAFLSLLLMLLTAIARMAPPYILKIAIDRFIAHRDFHGLSLMAGCYLAFIGMEYGALYFQIYMTQLFGQSVIKEMRLNTFAHLLALPVPYFDKTPHGKSLNYLTSDMENINEFITSGIVTTFADVITITGILGIMIYLSLPLTGVVLLFFFILFLVTNFFRKRFSAAYRDTRESVSEMNGFLQESFAGIYVSKAFNRKDAEISSFDEKNRRYIQAFKRVIFYLSLYFPLVESVGVLSVLAILWASGQVLAYGVLTFGTIVAFIEYSQKLYNPIRDLSEKYNVYQNALSSLEKLHKLHLMEREHKGGDVTQVTGDIELKDVWLSYEQDDVYALKRINLTIREGERVGIIGLTGSGKTSLINLLLGFYKPTKGEIGIGGKPMERYSLESIRKAFGIVSQDVFIFPRSVRENLFIDDESSLPKDLGLVLKGFSSEEGLNKAIAEDGVNLSEGEKQLISIGRVMAYKPRYLILDEATSRIDRYLEGRIEEALNKNFSSTTWVVIAHSMAFMAEMDRIVVIHDGRLAEEGTHTQLLANGGIYNHLYTIYANRKDQQAYENLRSETRRNNVE
ncbi:MAG TPA: ABC transporter ATP-binding protein [Syntrophorhabdales bacterium]|nr:ABC transporter ATP-binding protein [Syntrophorhabdales bacterium]